MRAVPSRRLVRWGVAGTLAAVLVFVFPVAALPLLTFDLLLAGAALLDWLLTPGPSVLKVERVAPARLAVLAQHTVTLVLRNTFTAPLHVRIKDTAPEAFHADPEEVVGTVPAQGETRLEYQIKPMTRGRFPWGAMHLRYRSLLGLWENQHVIEAAGDARVYPNLAALHRYFLLARMNRLETMGIRKARLRGGAWEFESLRDYAHGDDVRLIDWKATARRRKPIVRNHEAERNQSVLVLLDCGRLMNSEVDGAAKLDHAVNSALMLAHIALARGDRVGLCTFSHKVHAWLTPRAHLPQNRLITEALYDLRGDFTESDHGRCLRLIRSRFPKRALVILLTDFVDASTSADMVAHLQLTAHRHVVLFVALKDPFLERAARLYPAVNAIDGFRKAAAVELLRERREVLERLRQMGAHVIDADPRAATAPLINQYLQITFRGLL
jgi:uncharacterized protein (DUF58 family)